MGLGYETRAILDALKKQSEELMRIRWALSGALEPSTTQTRGGVYHTQKTISKASTFTDTEVEAVGFNLIQISTDGNLADISYKIRYLDATLGDSIEASLSPHVVGHHASLLITNDTAQSGKTVYIDRYLAPWIMLPAIQHGSPITYHVKPFFYGLLDEDGSANYFETDQAVTDTPTLKLGGDSSGHKHPPTLDTGVIFRIHYYMVPTNAVTYTLRFNSHALAANVHSRMHMLYESPAAQASGTVYDREVEIPFDLATIGELFFMLDWSGAPGNTYGFIGVSGLHYV